MVPTCRSRFVFCSGSLIALTLLGVPATAAAAPSDTTATSKSSDLTSTSDGWKKDRIFYATGAAGPPVGRWDDQFMNSFAGTPVGGAGWHTWSFLNKPAAAGWTGTYDSNPYPHVDTSPGGSTAKNWTQIKLYREPAFSGGGFFTVKWTKSNANAKVRADSPTVAATRITDPFDFSAPGSGNWSLGMEYTQYGEFSEPGSAGNLWSNYGLTLNQSSGPSRSYELLSVTLGNDGTAQVRSDLNGNDAETTQALLADQLNGVLMINGQVVTADQATTSLQQRYSPLTGWNLNPAGYTLENFEPHNPAHAANVFSLSVRVFLDPSTVGGSLSTDDGSLTVAVIPEPATWALLVAGLGLLGPRWRASARAGRHPAH